MNPESGSTDSAALPTPAQMLSMAGKVVVVTGAGGLGIGNATARRFVQAGATVVSHFHTIAQQQDPPHTSVVADLALPDGPSHVIDEVLAAHGRIDALVNNAGIQPTVPFAEMTDGQWQEMMDINLTAVHRLTQCATAAMRAQGTGGSIVHVASIEGHHPAIDHGHYATAKAGVIMHAKAAALSYGADGIRVNSVSPGLIHRMGIHKSWPEGVKRWEAAAPLGRLGSAFDVADACLFLCSDLSRWITGTDLVVDGGVLARPTW